MAKTSKRCYCAFCSSYRVVYRKKHVGLVDVVLTAIAALLMGQIVYQDFDPRAVVFFAIGLAIAELFIMIRWRLSVVCSKCGFDPLLYKRSPEQAAKQVKEHMRRRKEDPLSVFSPPPKLPVIKKKMEPPLSSSTRSPEASR